MLVLQTIAWLGSAVLALVLLFRAQPHRPAFVLKRAGGAIVSAMALLTIVALVLRGVDVRRQKSLLL